jgi:prepilin-type N-terminal cleavage/methylation domain-containing protein
VVLDRLDLLGQLMFNRLRQEDGFTLPELLITLVIGMIVALGGFTLVEVTMHRSGEVSARIEAVQSGRNAMDTLTRELRSQVCLPQSTNPADPRVSVIEATNSSITMFTELRDTSANAAATPTPAPGTILGPDKRQVTFMADGRIVETVWRPTALVNGVYTWAAQPTSTRELLVSVEQAKTDDGAAYVPFFQYFKYDFKTAAQQGIFAQPTEPVIGASTNGVLSSDQIKSVAKIKITYKSNPARKRPDGSAATVFTNQVFTRNVQPNADTDELSEPCK